MCYNTSFCITVIVKNFAVIKDELVKKQAEQEKRWEFRDSG